MNRYALAVVFGVSALAAGAAIMILADRQGWLPARGGASVADAVCRHGLSAPECALCDPSLVEGLGWCNEHDVPEALCTRCNPVLIAHKGRLRE